MKQVRIDGQKLKKALQDAGVESVTGLSIDMGLSHAYFSGSFNRNSIAVPILNQMTQRFGITYEDLKEDPDVIESEPKQTPEQLTIFGQDDQRTDRLYKTIFKAVYDGVKYAILDIKKEEIWPQ